MKVVLNKCVRIKEFELERILVIEGGKEQERGCTSCLWRMVLGVQATFLDSMCVTCQQTLIHKTVTFKGRLQISHV